MNFRYTPQELKRKTSDYISVHKYIPKYYTFLVEKSDMLGNLAMVSVFYQDEFEIEIAKAYVSNIQESLIQITVVEIAEGFYSNYPEIWERIDNNDLSIIKKLVVKNYITYTN